MIESKSWDEIIHFGSDKAISYLKKDMLSNYFKSSLLLANSKFKIGD